MFRKLLLLLILSLLPSLASAQVYKCKDEKGKTTFSGIPCATGSIPKAEPAEAPPNSSPSPEQAAPAPPKKEPYTKELVGIKASDPATQACFDHENTNERYPDPSSTKLLAATKKWVTVRDAGARQMVNIEVTSKNEVGMYVGRQSYTCLMTGNGVTINTQPYELLEP